MVWLQYFTTAAWENLSHGDVVWTQNLNPQDKNNNMWEEQKKADLPLPSEYSVLFGGLCSHQNPEKMPLKSFA